MICHNKVDVRYWRFVMPTYDVPPNKQDSWSRGQIVRTTIIFIEIIVLLTVVMLYTRQEEAQIPAAPVVAEVVLPQMVVPVEAPARNLIPTTVYVSESYRVFVVQNGVQHLAGVLDECDNRYVEVQFDGVLNNLHDASVLYPRTAVHAAAFLADMYEVNATATRIDIVLDTGSTYSISLHCNGEFGRDAGDIQGNGAFGEAAQVDNSSSVEDLVSTAQREFYDYGAGYGCQGDSHR
jgi:hypothetical protein